MREITFDEAVCEALTEEMRRDDSVFLIGEDLRYGRFTKPLWKEFGDWRVIDAPIAESGFTGAAVGAAITGMRPVVFHGRGDFMLYAYDSIVNQAAKWIFQTGPSSKLPLVIKVGTGGYRGSGCHHSQSLEAMFLNVPGIEIAIPSTPYDAKGLFTTALRRGRPVLFFEHGHLRGLKGDVPGNGYELPFGSADIKKEGQDVTIVATAFMVKKSLNVADRLQREGINVEVLDPRTLVPLDRETILKSVSKTGALVTVEEGCRIGGFGAEVATNIAEDLQSNLGVPVKRVANPDSQIPYKVENEVHVLPNERDVEKAVRNVIKRKK
jgi:pyruvate dehydrogenase E1 component beta subunit